MPYADPEKRRQAVKDSTRRRTEKNHALGLTWNGKERKHALPKHLMSDVDTTTRTGICAECGPVKVHRQGPQWKCVNANAGFSRASRIKSEYGITIDEYQSLLEDADGFCQSCGINFEISGRNVCIDHSHTTGKIRGVICHNCNAALGLLGDSELGVMSLLKYIKRTGT
jgi:hypothetical protein